MTSALAKAARDAFARREPVVAHLADQADAVARTCRDMAARFERGGRLLVVGEGHAATDAEHIAVEFVHPVIVGKRALPAMSLGAHGAAAELTVLARPDDILLGLAADPASPPIRRALEAAHERGLLVIALAGGAGVGLTDAPYVDHCLAVASRDPQLVKECNVTTYHVLWELVHVFLDTPGEPTADSAVSGVEALYPFLYGGSHPESEVLAAVATSTIEKVKEVSELRAIAASHLTDRLTACAEVLGPAFASGATLWTFGNGGSSTDAQQVAQTFIAPIDPYPRLPARCLTTDVAIVTALSNDVGFDVVFARQLRAFARAGDVAIGLSTSGGSANVLAAFDAAKQLGLHTVGIAGYGGGRMAESAAIDHLLAVESASVHRVQEVQTTIYHVLWELVQLAMV